MSLAILRGKRVHPLNISDVTSYSVPFRCIDGKVNMSKADISFLIKMSTKYAQFVVQLNEFNYRT